MNALLLLVSLLACTSVYDETIPNDFSEVTPALKEKIQELPEEEKLLLTRYLVRRELSSAFGGTPADPLGVTIKDALDQQRQFEEEQAAKEAAEKALAEKVAAQRAAEARLMNEVVTVAVASMTFVPSDIYRGRYQDSFALSIAFENKGQKDIAGVKGAVQFNDMFGTAIKSVGVSWDAGVKSGAVATWDASLDYNQFRDEDKKLASTPLEKMKITWTPDTILFADGSKLPADVAPIEQ